MRSAAPGPASRTTSRSAGTWSSRWSCWPLPAWSPIACARSGKKRPPPARRPTSAETRSARLPQRLVDQLAQLAPDRVRARRKQLGEEAGGQLLGRIHPERRGGRATPGELAHGSERLLRGRVDDDREP